MALKQAGGANIAGCTSRLSAAVWRSFQNLILLRDHLAALAAEHAETQRQSTALRASGLLDTHSASFPAEQGAAPSGEAHRVAVPAIVRRAAQCIGDDILTCAPSPSLHFQE